MPSGWMPEGNWNPSPSWPPAPPRWNFGVPESLKMLPLDLSGEISVGSVSQISQARIAEVGRAAADAVAWRMCTLAAETETAPVVTYLRHQDKAERDLLEARRKIYDPLLEEGRNWVKRLPDGSSEWVAAIATIRPVLDSRDAFMKTSRQRIEAVLQAADQSSSINKPAQDPPNSYVPSQVAPKQSRPAAAPGRPALDRSGHVRMKAQPRTSQPVELPSQAGSVAPAQSNPAAVTGFSLGIASFFLFSIPVFGLLLSLATTLVSGVGLSRQRGGMATRFRVFAIIGLVLGIIYTLMALITPLRSGY
jgi:hypothetical protein